MGILLGLMCALTVAAQTKIPLDNSWKVRSQDEVKDSVAMYGPAYDARGWVDAIVPGIVFQSYVGAGLEKDPNYGDNIYRVDKKKYDRNFWYRLELAAPDFEKGQHVELHFEGINRKGEIFFNGVRLGMLDGFMDRGLYDITGLLSKSGKNVLAVLVYFPGRPIPNHASPTYISSDGWDWMPSVPGLLMGITDDVYLTVNGGVDVVDPWVRSDLGLKRDPVKEGDRPAPDVAALGVSMGVVNHTGVEQEGEIEGTIEPGGIKFVRKVRLSPGGMEEVHFDTAHYKQLLVHKPLLWWPNGYGQPNLYTCQLVYKVKGRALEQRLIHFGIRQYTYDTLGGVFHIRVNGRRIFVRGGNWGMSEYMLRCRGSEYDLKVRLHREMHFNMIRNWIGSVTDEEFYDACDKYGIMVWDDFWLNSHPNLPDDVFAFNRNAVEKILRLRNHASIAVWCGDNEGYPLPPLNGWLGEDVRTFDAGDRWYQPNSHSDALTGSGPWTNFPSSWYFTKYPGGFGGDPGWGFRTEIGTAVFTTYESFKKFMPDSAAWPRNAMWDKHFFGPSAANAGPDRYASTIDKSYGRATGIQDFCRKAQLVNIETNKALYEGWQHHMWDNASGVMTWMSQSAYPSFVWQTYDYYYDLTGAYWGVRKACEPLHIQWSSADNSVKVINTTPDDLHGLTAEAVVYNMDGKPVAGMGKRVIVDAPSNAATPCFDLGFSMDNLAYKKKAYASSGALEAPDAEDVTDGSSGSRWSSRYDDDQWVYVDLGESKEISTVVLNWEAAYARAYKLQVSDDARDWKDVYGTSEGRGGVDRIALKSVRGRYVRMLGIRRATQFGYSLYEMEVYGKRNTTISPVHFIRLSLKDGSGKTVSDNFYWRGSQPNDYTGLNTLAPAQLQVRHQLQRESGKAVIVATVTNTGKSVAFAVRVQAVRTKDGERILPALMDDNYFTLLQGESKEVKIEFDEALLQGGGYQVLAQAYNTK